MSDTPSMNNEPDVWQYNGGAVLDAPEWLRHHLEFIDGCLILDRRTGKQEVRIGETLYRDVKGEIIHDVEGATS